MPFLRERVRPAPAPSVDPEVISRLLSDLNGEQFSVRDQASMKLRKLGEIAEPSMRKVLAGSLSVEGRRRVEGLIEALDEWSSEDLRALRTAEALEHMDTPDARNLLEALSKGRPGARLTREAEFCLKSLGRRHVALGKATAQDGKDGKVEDVPGEWVSLFNGKDLTNWKIDGKAEAFAVNETERAIIAHPSQPFSLLQSTRDYADFHLRFEFRIASKNANSGIHIRSPLRVNPAQRYQMEVQVLDDSSPYQGAQTGCLYWSKNNSSHFKRERDDLLKPFGEWNVMEIIAKDSNSNIRIVVNCKQALMADLTTVAAERMAHPGVTLTSGLIAFHADRGEVWYRRIEVKELKVRTERLKCPFPCLPCNSRRAILSTKKAKTTTRIRLLCRFGGVS